MMLENATWLRHSEPVGSEVSSRLCSGGYFVATVPDATKWLDLHSTLLRP